MRTKLTVVAIAGLLLAAPACSDDGDAGAAGGDPEEFCDAAASLQARFDEFNEADLADPDGFDAAFDELVAYVSGMEPPAEIADDWRISMSVFDGEEEVDEAELEQETITEAGENVTAYLRDECGIEPPGLAGDGGGDAPPAGAATGEEQGDSAASSGGG